MGTYMKEQRMTVICFFACISVFPWHFESAQHMGTEQTHRLLNETPGSASWLSSQTPD